ARRAHARRARARQPGPRRHRRDRPAARPGPGAERPDPPEPAPLSVPRATRHPVTCTAAVCDDGGVTDRLASLDASFLYMEDATTPMHVGSVLIFQAPPDGLDYDEIVGVIAQRISTTPRYRQVVRPVPGRIAAPVWVDDQRFDLSYHVRRAALPKPGDARQLGEFVGRVQSRLLDRARPLWE